MGGLAYICSRGSIYLSEKRETTLNRFSPIHYSIDCQFIGKDFDSLAFATLPKLDKTKGSIKQIRKHGDTVIKLTKISIQTESFLEPVIDKIHVRGFSGLAPPLVSIKMTFKYNKKSPIKIGSWPVRLVALAQLRKTYFSNNMQSLKHEISQIKQHGNKAQIEASYKRLKIFKQKMAIMSGELPLEGKGKIVIKSTSILTGAPSQWLSIILGILAVAFGVIGGIVAYLYLMHLKEGDMEP